MTIELTDDGTMDTVLRCTECGEEFRFNFQMDGPDEEPGAGLLSAAEREAANLADYNTWVESCIEEITEEHECEFNAERDCDEEQD